MATTNDSDLKLLDDCLTIWKGAGQTWEEFRSMYYTVDQALIRLEEAWDSGELSKITLSLSDHFERRNGA